MTDSVSHPEGTLKTCSRCRIQKPLSEFHKNKRKRGGLHYYCKECVKAPLYKEVATDGYKQCRICLETKHISEFYRLRRSTDGYKRECKQCGDVESKRWGEKLALLPPSNITQKLCRSCEQVKDASEFYPTKGGKVSKDKLTAQCKDCIRKSAIVRMSKRTYEDRRSIDMRFRYGVTREEYNQIHEKQNGLCAICLKPETKKQYSKVMELGIDHDHVSGKIRGLLCADCNRAIGLLRDDIKRVNNLLAYINKPILSIDQIPSKKRQSTKSQRSKLKKYGITPEIYYALFDAQDGLCTICGLAETATLHGIVKTLAVDHSHTTGQVRGLLCQACNRALGLLKDSPTLLENALKYLQQYNL